MADRGIDKGNKVCAKVEQGQANGHINSKLGYGEIGPGIRQSITVL